jgi:hypothetical protein
MVSANERHTARTRTVLQVGLVLVLGSWVFATVFLPGLLPQTAFVWECSVYAEGPSRIASDAAFDGYMSVADGLFASLNLTGPLLSKAPLTHPDHAVFETHTVRRGAQAATVSRERTIFAASQLVAVTSPDERLLERYLAAYGSTGA